MISITVKGNASNRNRLTTQDLTHFNQMFRTVFLSILGLYLFSCSSRDTKVDKPSHSVPEATNSENSAIVDSMSLATAKDKFDIYCTQCHGKEGQGLIGPNLTDAYWIHGNSLSKISEVIREGIPAKGMLAWKNILTPEEIQAISTLLLNFTPSQAPDAKDPEGYLYAKNGNLLRDSLVVAQAQSGKTTGVSLDGNVTRGQKLFNGSFGCARCHGRDIQGLTDNRDLKRMTQRYGREAGLVFDVVTKDGRPGTAMPPWLHLKTEDLKDLKSFIFSIQEPAQ